MAAGRLMITLFDRCQAIELLVLDVDGVLTNGGIVYGDDRLEIKQFHVRDGSGLHFWKRAGKRAAVLTGRSSSVVSRRAAELGLSPIIQGSGDKLKSFLEVLPGTGLGPEQVCYIGDDLLDLPPMTQCGLAVAVADACPDVREIAHYITSALGGSGAVREVVELILRAQGRSAM